MARVKKLDFSMKNIQKMLYVLNTVFLLIGVLLTTIGATIHVVYREFELFIESYYVKPVEMFISIGVITILISFLGYVATIKKSTMLVNLFWVFLFLLLIFEIALMIVGFLMSSTIFNDIKTNMNKHLDLYNKDENSKESWDFMQQRIGCCGVSSPFNWALKDIDGPQVTLESYTFTVPQSCCSGLMCNAIYVRGCINVLGKYASDCTITITCCVTLLVLTQVFGVIFAGVLSGAIRTAKTLEEMKRQQNRQMIFEQMAKGQADKVVTPVLYTPSSSEA